MKFHYEIINTANNDIAATSKDYLEETKSGSGIYDKEFEGYKDHRTAEIEGYNHIDRCQLDPDYYIVRVIYAPETKFNEDLVHKDFEVCV